MCKVRMERRGEEEVEVGYMRNFTYISRLIRLIRLIRFDSIYSIQNLIGGFGDMNPVYFSSV